MELCPERNSARSRNGPFPGAATCARQPRSHHRRQQIEQAALRPTQIAKLIEEEDVHSRPARRRRAPRSTAEARASR